jgi:ATP-dependent protease HslVU (ClpYQ) peptidase subunit
MKRTRLASILLAVSLAIGSGAAFAADAEKGATAYPKDVTLSSGKKIHVLAVGPLYFRDPKTPPALMVSYETSLRISDMDALRAEVDDIWKDVRKDADKAKYDAVVIAAQEKAEGFIVTNSKGYRFVFERQADGAWPDHAKK